jgi:ABC-2 type transport system permease protein
MIGLNVRRMRAIATRHAIVFKRSPHRWFDVAAPAIDSILFGSLAVVLAKSTPGDNKTVPAVLTGLLLFHILFASNLALSTGFLEETWTRNLLNLMVTPLRETEYLIGTAVFGLSKVFIGMVFVSCTALLFYAFDITPKGLAVLPQLSPGLEALAKDGLKPMYLKLLQYVSEAPEKLPAFVRQENLASLEVASAISHLVRLGYFKEGGLWRRSLYITDKGKAVLGRHGG